MPLSQPTHTPRLLVAYNDGEITEHPQYCMTACDDNSPRIPGTADLIPLPHGSTLFSLPGRIAVGFNEKNSRFAHVASFRHENVYATAAFVAPGYTSLMRPAYTTLPDAPLLPLYCYTAVGWADDRFWVAARRIDPSRRQDAELFNEEAVRDGAHARMKEFPHNRLVHHLMNNCCLRYHCPAARNYALRRWEMPLPVSRACNSQCLGCISLQPGDHLCAAQNRIAFTPTADEIAEITVPHLELAEEPIASFGQGCEGEPLTEHELLRDSIRSIRSHSTRGTVNVNSNASYPNRVSSLIDAGLNSIRISLNSAQPDFYSRYFRPQDYSFDDVMESLDCAANAGIFVSLNYFVFPGFTNSADELDALRMLLTHHNVSMIQWRNLNIDPEYYISQMKLNIDRSACSVSTVIDTIQKEFPELRHGYYNPLVT